MIELHILTGPDQGQSFEMKENAISIGRARENDIKIKDRTVSRKHLQIVRKEDQYFVRDMKSQNGTFFNGTYIKAGEDVEVLEGVPIVIGMSVICVGKGCLEYIGPYLDSIEMTRGMIDGKEEHVQNRKTSNQKILELIYKVSNILTESLDVGEIAEKILDNLFDLLKRIDRGVLILMNPDNGEVMKTITRLNEKKGKKAPEGYCQEVVDKVLQEKKAVLIADPQEDTSGELAKILKAQKIGSVICVPLKGSTQILGVIYVDALNKTHSCRKRDLPVIADLSRRAALAIEHALLYEGLDKAENE